MLPISEVQMEAIILPYLFVNAVLERCILGQL